GTHPQVPRRGGRSQRPPSHRRPLRRGGDLRNRKRGTGERRRAPQTRAADRGQLYDPLRRRRRPAHRPGAPPRRTRHLRLLGAYLGAVAFQIGNLSMGFLVASLAGYIAFGIADRPGIAPGFTVGAVAVLMGAGFIGGIIGGLLAGYVALWIGSLNAPRWLRGL